MSYSVESLRGVKIWLQEQEQAHGKRDERDGLLTLPVLLQNLEKQLLKAYEDAYNASKQGGSYYDR